ncbi:VOC family protein [Permianibacter aggregans]|uniref:Catechol 2,3-dioxygenase-like lactoylglutathione lyase family enzyme n=1 Tax=Permianibacter aggregans TaxID=1510150 RepID=A0A4R6UNB7_9GAMM|nr:VOC family protein [Permianibacter aggregans]QGX40757.1 VOC family protein [Permianibacter aggregans]TDQ48431.1 catechol 2,3-dioxygenase-like lactoylglutathione lyase family enzyme [Permianibacter aggregans]
MFDHLSTYVTDYSATKRFYTEVLSVLGYGLQMEFVAEWNKEFPTQHMCAFGPSGKPAFWIIEVKTPYTPRHIEFAATNRSMVAQFHERGLENGGKDNGAPGLRPMYHEHYFGAFLLDQDGNNIEAVCHQPES